MVKVLVHAVGALGRGIDGNIVFGTIVHEVGPTLEAVQKLSHSPGSDHFQIGSQGVESELETNLVVSFAGSSVGKVLRPHFLCHIQHGTSDTRTGDRSTQKVAALVESIGFDGRVDEVGDELPLQVFDVDFFGPDGQSLSLTA